MKRSKLFAAGTALVMALALVSCGKAKATTGSHDYSINVEDGKEGNIKKVRPKETVTLEVFSQLANYSGLQTGWFADLLLEKFNVKFNIIPSTGGALQTRMEGGNLGDLVIFGNNTDDYTNAIDQGLLLDWEEDNLLANWGPYIQDNMALALQKNKYIDSPDQKLHGFGHNVSTSAEDIQSFFYTWDLRWDLYEQIGKPEINTLDDLVDVLAQMKEICPTDDNGKTTYGVSLFNDWDGDMVMWVKALATAYFGYDEFYTGLYNPEDGVFHGALEDNGPYLYTLKILNKMSQKGLVDPDSMTQKYDGMSEDYQNGTAFWNIFNWMGSGTYNSEAHIAAGKAMYPVAPKAARPIVYGQSVYGGERVWTIGSKTAYPELCMAIINWFCTPEGFMTIEYGPRGVTWDIKDGKTYLTDFGKTAHADQNNTMMPEPFKGSYNDGAFQLNNITWCVDAYNPLTTDETYNKIFWASERTEATTDIEKSWREWANASTPDGYLQQFDYVVAPGTLYTAAGIPDDLEMKKNQITECIKNGSWNAIYAKDDAEFDSIVAKMKADADSYGYAEVVAFADQQAMKRAAAEKQARGE